MDQTYRMALAVSQAAVNYASVALKGMVSWNLVLNFIVPPAYLMIMPVIDLQWLVSMVQSESTAPCINAGSLHCVLGSMVCVWDIVTGSGRSGKSSRGYFLQK